MYQQLKIEIKEIIEIVNQCPEALKEKCFELLIENYLTSNAQPVKLKSQESLEPKVVDNEPSVIDTVNSEENEMSASEDIEEKEFHVKIRRFLQDNKITGVTLNKLYYKEDGKLLPLYDTVKSTKMSDCQIRIALLSAFESSYNDANGEMAFNYEAIRSRCQTMKCYSRANFASYFKNSKDLWETWPDKVDKNTMVTLSASGKKELVKVLLDLADGE
ncbi:MAG: hypothetical protein FWE11_04695 [Defluviitaleaceae bacterium]|nr:hypothetical protein [Defluviitaleaceae bacterium]